MLRSKNADQMSLWDLALPVDILQLPPEELAKVDRWLQELQQAGVEIDKHFRDQTNAVRKLILGIARVLQRRSHEAQDKVRQITFQRDLPNAYPVPGAYAGFFDLAPKGSPIKNRTNPF